MFGLFDPTDRIRRASKDPSLRRLSFPPAYPETTNTRYEPSTAIQQLSTGRSSVLGLADDGKVWMWQSNMGFQVRPMHVDLVKHKVKRVVAGASDFQHFMFRRYMYVNSACRMGP